MTEGSSFDQTPEQESIIGRLILYCLKNKLVVGLFVLAIGAAGFMFAPFDWKVGDIKRYPVSVDAIPDIGENQQIIFTQWMGRSPQDVEDQITYPLTVSLLGVPKVKTIRSYSMFGFSTIYVIFKEDAEFYWSRTRILEKLNSLPAGTLPAGVQPALGPDATPLGQIYWYTLEGRDPNNKPVGGWDLEELRTIQDWYARYWLLSADGVAEVASVGGHVKEYQVDVDPDAMRAYGVTLTDVFKAVKASNIDVGAKTIEMNNVEYFVRGIGFIRNTDDIAESVVKVRENVPILVKHVATVTLGPAMRRGALDKDGAPAVGGVVVARYGDNPLKVIQNVKDKIEETKDALPIKAVIDHTKTTKQQIAAFAKSYGFNAFDANGLDQKAWMEHLRTTPKVAIADGNERDARQLAKDNGFQGFKGPKVNCAAWVKYLKSVPRDQWPQWVTLSDEWPPWVTTSRVTIIPFYDRTGLIYETLGTLNDAISQQILITAIVVIVMVLHLRSGIIITGMLPLAVLLCFVGMKAFGVDANIVALSGIVIAIGTIVDMGIVICENILRHLDEAPPDEPRLQVVHRAASEVGGAVLTAVATTVVSFLPVFTMIGTEGKLFKPLAYTKTFALLASIVIALTVLPPAAHILFCGKISGKQLRTWLFGALGAAAVWLAAYGVGQGSFMIVASGVAMVLFCAYNALQDRIPQRARRFAPYAASAIVVALIACLLTMYWEPLGPQLGLAKNFLFVGVLIAGLLAFFELFRRVYPWLLRWFLVHKITFAILPLAVVILGVTAWLGFENFFFSLPNTVESAIGVDPNTTRSTTFWVGGKENFPGFGKEFMPPLDEGSYLFMPTTMVHASIGETLDIISKQDMAFRSIPEIDSVVAKLGRAETPLDPAPISMIETVINYKPEYKTDKNGRRIKFKYDKKTGKFARDGDGELIPDRKGMPFRQWRDHIKKPDDIWDEIVEAGKIPGTTSAPRLQPIAARIVMLQSGMRAPMGVKVKGTSLAQIEEVGLQIEQYLKEVPSVQASAVVADRIVGKPYLEIVPNRPALARYGVAIRAFQDVVEIAIGGKRITSTIEGRERFPVRVRYQREMRDDIDKLGKILVPGAGGVQIPISQLAQIRFLRGPQVIKSEDTFLVGYVVFDMKPGHAEVDVVEDCIAYLQAKRDSGEFALPRGVSYDFAGNYQNQIRATETLTVILPIALLMIFLLIYFQFNSVPTTILVFSGIFVAWAGGFLLIWMYAQDGFLDFSVFGVNMRDLFQVHTINLSVAVWVGFLALFGIATDNGVIQSTYLQQIFRERQPKTVSEIREATVAAAVRRVRPCLMTTATTILALIPVLTSTGRGSDVMVPMAIPSFGGMLVVLLSIFVVPILYCLIQEFRAHTGWSDIAVGVMLILSCVLGVLVVLVYGDLLVALLVSGLGFLVMLVYCAFAAKSQPADPHTSPE